jgi:hypothetical protein
VIMRLAYYFLSIVVQDRAGCLKRLQSLATTFKDMSGFLPQLISVWHFSLEVPRIC